MNQNRHTKTAISGSAAVRCEQARDMFNDALKCRNRYSLLTEDVHPLTGELWGNFPQTYSMAGLILTATRLSRSWEDRPWRG
jgi:GH15 family glucan-1,4-alpha-glucosidase